MVLIISVEYSGPMTPHYVLTEVDDDVLEYWWRENETEYIWRRKYKTVRGLTRAIMRYYRLSK